MMNWGTKPAMRHCSHWLGAPILRTQDTLARYGGEEFVILMPDTPLSEAIKAMTRLQRELTKNFFLAGKHKILITFSAGVTQLSLDESGADAIKRADRPCIWQNAPAKIASWLDDPPLMRRLGR